MAQISNPVSGGQWHLNHLTILRRFSWHSLAYMCTVYTLYISDRIKAISSVFKKNVDAIVSQADIITYGVKQIIMSSMWKT